jgi:alpha-N-arabinofuranosidase
MFSYRNPVIPGYHPDPSICRDGTDYYLVNSSFEYFPGVPIYHSRNLVNWHLIGHCLTRNSQIPLEGCGVSKGIYAPTIRKHRNTFFMTTTNVSAGENFIVHTDSITGPWSEPAYIDQGGIDPSLTFIADQAYFCSTGIEGNRPGIFLCRLDPFTGKKLDTSICINYGCGGRFPEGPHIYHINGWYYLLLAEGGTEYGHAVTIQRSQNICGPWEPCPYNPILSHRDRGSHPIQATGHADMVEDQNGVWWMVCLGIRPLGWPMLHNLGRETFLTPLQWKDGWPFPLNGNGVELEMTGPLPAAPEPVCFDFNADFEKSALALEWTFIRNPEQKRYKTGNGELVIEGSDKTLSDENTNPAFIGIRQQAFEIESCTVIRKDLAKGTFAGITAYYNHDYHYDLYLERDIEGMYFVVVNRRIHDLEKICYRHGMKTQEDMITLRISTDRTYYRFAYRMSSSMDNGWMDCGSGLTAGLCTETTHTMTFTGVFIGLFAVHGPARFSGFSVNLKG